MKLNTLFPPCAKVNNTWSCILKDQGVGGKIILKWILGKSGFGVRIGLANNYSNSVYFSVCSS
jgi:hypothetical protein